MISKNKFQQSGGYYVSDKNMKYTNPAKSTYTPKRGKKNKKQKSNKVSKGIGITLGVIQLIGTALFLFMLFMLNMLPTNYYLIMAAMLGLLSVLTFVTQILSKKNAIFMKIVSILMSCVLFVGSFYINKVTDTFNAISLDDGTAVEINQMVVVVRVDDPAVTIEDAKDYDFGVQFVSDGTQVEETVFAINEELGSEINEVQLGSRDEQASALLAGEVDAIIYNSAYEGIFAEFYEGYSNDTKIIYTYDIEVEKEAFTPEVAVESEAFTVLISGIDVYGPISTNSRSDVNITATINPVTHQILLVTTPRDYYVEIPEVTGGAKDKLTHAGIYGIEASMSTLEQLYGIDIPFYARVNFTSVIEIVDALGGVDVYSEQAFTTYDNVHVVQGMNHFDGVQALSFSRDRYHVDGGDFQRGRNQQAVIEGIINKAISPAILTGAMDIMASVSDNMQTNMSTEQIQELVKTQLTDGASWNIVSMSAEGTGDSQYCYSYSGGPLYVAQPVQSSVDSIKAAIEAVENGEVLQ